MWVVVDKLTKSTHFLTIKTGMSLENLAELYIDQIVRLHDVPVTIVFYWDSQFVVYFWESLDKALGMKLTFCIIFHPQTDGQSKRII